VNTDYLRKSLASYKYGIHLTIFIVLEALYIYIYTQIFHRHKVLNNEQQINATNPLYEPANITRIHPRDP